MLKDQIVTFDKMLMYAEAIGGVVFKGFCWIFDSFFEEKKKKIEIALAFHCIRILKAVYDC